jgi:cobalt-zinc-cadmium efflux system outer membrane protein
MTNSAFFEFLRLCQNLITGNLGMESLMILYKPVRSIVFFLVLLWGQSAQASDLRLQDLIPEALKNNPEILAAQAGVQVSEFKIPQAKALPDPMFMFGYQNEGYSNYTYGEMQGAQWMFSGTQMFPFWGKRALKGEMAAQETESLKAVAKGLHLKTVSRIKELYFDLLFAYKNKELIKDRTELFARIEEAALSRYASGMAPQQEVLMAQTEKYMLLEKEEMNNQKIQAAEGMLNVTLGREVQSPLGRPQVPVYTTYPYRLDELLNMARENSPEIMSKGKMIKGAEVKVRMAEREYYPDFTLGANLFKRTGAFEDMWSLTAQINIPLFFRQKQRKGVLESKAVLSQGKQELQAAQNMLASNLRDSYSMVKSAERLMELYKEGLIPKTVQDFQLALSGYTAGKVEAITVISRLKALLEFELLYWGQFAEREKAIARIEAITGTMDFSTEEKRP